MRFSPKQVVTMVCALSAAVVIAPVSVGAATGQLVNVVDSVSGRDARVSTNGALLVENRAYVGTNAFNVNAQRYGFGWIPLVSTTGPTKIAITKLTLSGPYDPVGGAGEVLLEAFTRTSGSEPCTGPGSTGYTRHTLQHIWVPVRQTIQLTFDGQALVVPGAATGQPLCFGLNYYAGNTNLSIYASANGYKYGNP